MFNRTSITLSRAAFTANINAINTARGRDSLALVVKANAYGHGMAAMAQLGQEHNGVSWLCTVGIEEALVLRKQGITKPILVLSFLDGSIDEGIAHDIHLSVSSYDEALAVAAAARRVGKSGFAHLKIDTGIGRMGFLPDELLQQLPRMVLLPGLELYGIRTHLSDTGHADHCYSKKQLKLFDQLLDQAQAIGITFKCTHVQSSSSLDLIPERRYSFVRVGAAAFGLWKSEEQRQLLTKKYPGFNLRPVLEWRATISQVKEVPAGSYIGYSRAFKTTRPTKLAVVPIGYWDGYAYAQANTGVAVLNNHYVPVLGKISMNITAFDVTQVPDVRAGDQIVLLGNAPGILVHELAQCAGIISNLVTTPLYPSIERKVVEDHADLMLQNSYLSEASFVAR